MKHRKKRIICIGNRYLEQDAAGPLVHDCLMSQPLPLDVAVIDGGLGGLDLLRFVEHAERVVFVDAIADSASSPGEIVVLDADEAAAAADATYDHQAGLGYLLRVLPKVIDGAMPEILLVGIQGLPEQSLIAQAAQASLALAIEGVKAKMPEHSGAAN